MHRFNEQGIKGIKSKIHVHKPIRKTAESGKKIVEVANKNSRDYYRLPFSTWSLRVLAGYVSRDKSCRPNKPYSDKKYPHKRRNKIQTIRLPWETVLILNLI